MSDLDVTGGEDFEDRGEEAEVNQADYVIHIIEHSTTSIKNAFGKKGPIFMCALPILSPRS